MVGKDGPPRQRLSLVRAFLGFMALGALVFFSVTLFFTNDAVDQLQTDVLDVAIQARGEHVALDIVKHLEGHWVELENLAQVMPFLDKATMRDFLTQEVADARHVDWAAYVGVQGDVLIASHRRLEGENVSETDWFRQALLPGPHIGISTTADGHQLLVMTMPVQATGGVKAGYLTFHFPLDWLGNMVAEVAKNLALGIIVVDMRGDVVLSTVPHKPSHSDLTSVRNAMAGQEVTTIENWEGIGKVYADSVPEFPASALPPLGWRMVAIISFDQFSDQTARLRLSLGKILGLVSLVLFAMSLGFIRIFLVPLHRLVENAHEIADGVDIIPKENHRTAELSMLSSAISRMQGRMLHAEDQLAAKNAKD